MQAKAAEATVKKIRGLKASGWDSAGYANTQEIEQMILRSYPLVGYDGETPPLQFQWPRASHGRGMLPDDAAVAQAAQPVGGPGGYVLQINGNVAGW